MNQDDLKERYDWKRIRAPKRWSPKDPGEELLGYYGGKTVRNGSYGQYEVVLVHVPNSSTMMISGVQIVQLTDAANIQLGWPVRIVWLGTVGERKMKCFDFFVAEGDPVSPEDLPKVKEQPAHSAA